nr:MAG TPA: hypothetical protein [Caudoviricetes sp.]
MVHWSTPLKTWFEGRLRRLEDSEFLVGDEPGQKLFI